MLSKHKNHMLRLLNYIETIGNRLPDPAILFFLLFIGVWFLSLPLSLVDFDVVHPITDDKLGVVNQVNAVGLATFLSNMVNTFITFPPLGIVLVAMLGVGVAEHTGFISVVLRSVLENTPKQLVTPMVIMVGIASHYAEDAGYVLVVPLGGMIFYTVGRHPLAGIAAAFAGVSGGFSANFWVPNTLDPLLQGFTQSAAHLLDENVNVSVLCNNIFTAASAALVVLVCWPVTDRIVEPRLSKYKLNEDLNELPSLDKVTTKERQGMITGLLAAAGGFISLILWLYPEDSALRLNGQIVDFNAPIMQSIVALIFLLFIIPAIVHGYVSGTVRSHRDIVEAMSKSMGAMSYYIVLVFFCSLFIWMFGQTNIGVILSVAGAAMLKSLDLPGAVTLFGVIILVGIVNLLVGSSSAKWGLVAPIFVPMLMQIGISPDLTQAAYRVGDSITNIITPLMPFFPLVVVFCQRYVKSAGIGTLVSIMLPYSLILLFTWSGLLFLFWSMDIPLGVGSTYTYP